MTRVLLVILLALLVPVSPATAGEVSITIRPSNGIEPLDDALPQQNTGRRAYIDPETGELLPHPPPGILQPLALSVTEAELISTYSGDLPTEHLPDGSTVLDTRGRFQQMSVSVIPKGARQPIVHCGRVVVGHPDASTPESQTIWDLND